MIYTLAGHSAHQSHSTSMPGRDPGPRCSKSMAAGIGSAAIVAALMYATRTELHGKTRLKPRA